MESAAIDLKEEREKKKITLEQIAADTRISKRYLQSIEEGRYGDLPGGVYNRAFLKAYCESINLDPHEILERYDAQVSTALSEKSQKAPFTPPPQHSFFIPVPVLIWSIMLLISAIGLYFSRGWISELFSPYFSEKPIADAGYQSPAPPPPVSTESETTALPPSVIAETSGKTGTVPADRVTARAQKTPTPESAAAPSTAPSVSEPTGESRLRMEIVASEQCWISVDTDGRPASRRLLEPGEEQVFNASERLFILIGNAGGVKLKLNGQPAKPLGNPGEVIKMNIDLDNLQQFLDTSAG